MLPFSYGTELKINTSLNVTNEPGHSGRKKEDVADSALPNHGLILAKHVFSSIRSNELSAAV